MEPWRVEPATPLRLPLLEQCQRFWKSHLVVEFGEANHITAATTAVAVEKVPAGIHQKAGLMIGMKGTQPHPPAAAQSPGRPPILSLQIVQQRNLLFQLVKNLATHGLLASMGRIRRIAVQSQARMVGDVAALQPTACQSFAASRVPTRSKRPAHRRTVDGSGDRDASATSGIDRSQLLSDRRNKYQACYRQWRL